jgi:zinc protease
MKSSAAKDLQPYVDAVGAAVLLPSTPAPGAVVKTTTRDNFGITEWELANGAKVVLKPTTFKEDEILFRAYSPGGTSLASDADYIPASFATGVVGLGGLGGFNAIDLRKITTGKTAAVSASIQ